MKQKTMLIKKFHPLLEIFLISVLLTCLLSHSNIVIFGALIILILLRFPGGLSIRYLLSTLLISNVFGLIYYYVIFNSGICGAELNCNHEALRLAGVIGICIISYRYLLDFNAIDWLVVASSLNNIMPFNSLWVIFAQLIVFTRRAVISMRYIADDVSLEFKARSLRALPTILSAGDGALGTYFISALRYADQYAQSWELRLAGRDAQLLKFKRCYSGWDILAILILVIVIIALAAGVTIVEYYAWLVG